MNRLLGTILFENQDAWPFRVRQVVFHDDSRFQAVDDVAHVNTVCGEFLVAVERNTHFATSHQCSYLFQGLAQFRDPLFV